MMNMSKGCSSKLGAQSFLMLNGTLCFVKFVETATHCYVQWNLLAIIGNPNPGVPGAIKALANTEYVEAILYNAVHHINKQNLTFKKSLCVFHRRVYLKFS